MKKTLLVLVTLLIAAYAFASTPLSFTGSYALFGGENGRTIRRAKVDLDDGGYVMATGPTEATAISENFSVKLGPKSLAVLSNDNGQTTVYLLYGTATVAKDGAKTMNLYTPTTYSKLIGRGEYAVVSSDEEELIFNFSRYNLNPYDAIKGVNVTVPAAYGYDYIHSTGIPLDYSYAISQEEIEEAVKVPAAPIMVEVKSDVVIDKKTPGIPVFVEVLQTINEEPEAKSPEAPEGLTYTQNLSVPSVPGGIKVTQTLVYIPERPAFASEPIRELVFD